jgi:hypothetical protein
MAIDKALYQAPKGIDALAAEEEPLEIEIEPDHINISDDEIEIDIQAVDPEFGENLAENLDDSLLALIAQELTSDYDSDVASRKDWLQTYVDGLELLGLKIEERSEPWEGACGIYHPILAEALVKFQSETIMSLFPAQGPVRTKIIGKETKDKIDAAHRVETDMNHRLTDRMPEYRPETERTIWGLGLAGNAFKKVYFDPNLNRPMALFVPAEDVVVPYGAANLESADRVTHVMRKTENELRKLQVMGFYRDIDLGTPINFLDEVEKKIAEKQGFRASSDDRYKLLEMHVNLDLEGYEHTDEEGKATGIALPYVVTIEKGTSTILSIRRNWRPDDETFQKRAHFVHYGYIPGFGFYHFGLIHLIGAYAKSGTSIVRQLVDAGSLANLPGGFKTRGLRVKGDDTPIAPGEFRDVDVPSGAMKDNIMPLPYKEPSQTLLTLLNGIIEEARRFANTADLSVSDMSAAAPVGTTFAILERTLKVMSAVQARIHFALKQELKLLKEIIAEDTPEDYDFDPDSGNRHAKKSDYDSVDLIPVSDPNASTMAQKIVQWQAVQQLAQANPQFFNMQLLNRQMVEIMGISNANKLVPMADDIKPTDPVSENQNILMQKPVKAFEYQDHEAHITVHMMAMKDPKILQVLGQGPQAIQLQAAMQAHINEHLGFAYRVEIEKQLGMSLPPKSDEMGDDVGMNPEVEARLAPMLAQAAQRLLQNNQQQAAQQQAQQQAQDPLVQMQQQELQLKQAELERKKQKDMVDAQLKASQQQIEKSRIQAQTVLEAAKTQAGLQSQETRDKIQIGADLVKHISQKNQDHQIQNKQLFTQGLRDAHQVAEAEQARLNAKKGNK